MHGFRDGVRQAVEEGGGDFPAETVRLLAQYVAEDRPIELARRIGKLVQNPGIGPDRHERRQPRFLDPLWRRRHFRRDSAGRRRLSAFPILAE